MKSFACNVRLENHARRLWINFALTNDWENHYSIELLVDYITNPLWVDKFSSCRGNTTAMYYVDKRAVANPNLHCLHLLRRLSLYDGAVNLCVASPLHSILLACPPIVVRSTHCYFCLVVRPSIIPFSAILNRTLASSNASFRGFDVWTYCLCILCKVESYSSFYLPAVGLAPCAMVERCCPRSCFLNGTGKK